MKTPIDIQNKKDFNFLWSAAFLTFPIKFPMPSIAINPFYDD